MNFRKNKFSTQYPRTVLLEVHSLRFHSSSRRHYIPMIGGVANFFCFGILFWSLSLVVSKLITIFIATAEPVVDEIKEEMHDVIEKIDHMAHDSMAAVDHFAHDLMAKEVRLQTALEAHLFQRCVE